MDWNGGEIDAEQASPVPECEGPWASSRESFADRDRGHPPRAAGELFGGGAGVAVWGGSIEFEVPTGVLSGNTKKMEIQEYLPPHAREHFIRVRNLKWEEARTSYNSRLLAMRREATARGVLRSGEQELAEWQLSQEHVGNLAKGYFEAALETCSLYNLKLDGRLYEGIKLGIKEFLLAQRRNAIQHSAQGVPGAVKVPLSVRQQLSGEHNLPRFNEILVELERMRVAGTNSSARVNAQMSQTFNVTGPNARVNLNSTDASTNVVQMSAPFGEVRKAIESGVSDGIERANILARLSDLEAARDRGTGTKKYQEFIAAAANHMALIGPYLPLIGHWVHSLAAVL